MFQDDLLIRSPNGFEPTLGGRKILDELEELLPRMENLVAPALFDPKFDLLFLAPMYTLIKTKVECDTRKAGRPQSF